MVCPGIAVEALAPEPVAQDDGQRAAGTLLLGREEAAVLRRRAQQVEQGTGDVGAANLLGMLIAGHIELIGPVQRQVLERSQVVPPVGQRRNRDAANTAALLGARDLEDPHQSVRGGVGQRLEQHAVDDAEDTGRGPDPESQREDGHRGESLAARQYPNGVADVGDQGGHTMLSGPGAASQ